MTPWRAHCGCVLSAARGQNPTLPARRPRASPALPRPGQPTSLTAGPASESLAGEALLHQTQHVMTRFPVWCLHGWLSGNQCKCLLPSGHVRATWASLASTGPQSWNRGYVQAWPLILRLYVLSDS